MFKDVLRIRLFGMFIGLYDEYGFDQLMCYMEAYTFIRPM